MLANIEDAMKQDRPFTKEEVEFLFKVSREAEAIKKQHGIQGSLADWTEELIKEHKRLRRELWKWRLKTYFGKVFWKSFLLNVMRRTRQWVMSLFG